MERSADAAGYLRQVKIRVETSESDNSIADRIGDVSGWRSLHCRQSLGFASGTSDLFRASAVDFFWMA